MMAFPESFTLLSRTVTGQDADGNDIYTPISTAFRGAFAPSGSTVLVQGQLTVVGHDTIYAAEGSPIPLPTDQIIARGSTRTIDGIPEVYRNPFTGWTPGPVITLVSATG